MRRGVDGEGRGRGSDGASPPHDGRATHGARPAGNGPLAWRPLGQGLLAAAILAAPLAVRAQVLDIDAAGAVRIYQGPAVYTPEGVSPIAARPSPAPDDAAAGGEPDGDVARRLHRSARRHALDPALVQAVAWQESRFRPDAVSPAGAVGVMQLTAGAARDVGVDRFDLEQNIDGGAAYLRRMLDAFGGDVVLGLAAYNAGPGAVRTYGGVPPFRETQAYVRGVLRRIAERPTVRPSGDFE